MNFQTSQLILLLCCILLIIIIIILYCKNKKQSKVLGRVIIEKHQIEVARKGELKDYFQEEWSNQEKKLQDKLSHHEKELDLKKQNYDKEFELHKRAGDSELQKIEALLKEKEKRYNEVNQDLDLYRQGKMKEIDTGAKEYEQRKRLLVDASIIQYREVRGNLYNRELEEMETQKKSMTQEISELKSELEEERNKRAAINEEIRRQREVEEQQDFYRIQLDPNDTDDVEILRSVAPRLRHPEAINKVIWTAYYQKPLAELRKRVAIESSGIYKITRIKTGEVYIGKAVNVSDRWTSHVKTALGVGTLASSQLHRVMKEDGPEQFIFELLEETPKEKLSERESYYIDFYDSKTYGLNTIRGEQK